MIKFTLLYFVLVMLVGCSPEKQTEQSQDQGGLATETKQDSTKFPQEPEGFKSPHQEHSEEHKGEKSKIK